MKTVALTESKATPIADAERDLRPLSLRSMFWRPNYLGISAWIEHIPFAFWLVEAHHPRVIVELGTHYGVSYFSFCQAVDRLGLDTQCYAIDSWKGDEHAGIYGEEVFDFVRLHNEAHYSSFSRLIRSTFDEALKHFSDGTVDLLHIDGLHTLEAVRHDFEAWLPKLSPRAVVVLHDTNVRERNFGVFKLFEALKASYPSFEFVHGHGLGVIGVGPDQSDHLARLFAADRDRSARQALHEVFGRLGHACAEMRSSAEMRMEAESLRQQLSGSHAEAQRVKMELERKLNEANAVALQVGQERERAKSATESSLREHGALIERLRVSDELIGELRSQLALARSDAAAAAKHAATESEHAIRLRVERELLGARLSELEVLKAESATFLQSLKSRDADLAAARKETADCKREIDALVLELKDLRGEREAVRSRLVEVEALKVEAARLARALESKEVELASLNDELAAAATKHIQALDAKDVELASAKNESAATRAEFVASQKQQQELEANIAARFEELATLTRLLSEAKAEREENARVLSERNRDIEVVHKQISELRLEKAQLHASVADRFRETAILSRAVADHEEELRLRIAQVEGLQNQRAELVRRLSWRLNAPLRGAYDALGGAGARRRRLIQSSGLFDANWYLAQNPDVSQTRFDPLEHFIRYGEREGRDPSLRFSVRKYLELYPEVYAAGYNALAHYVEFGRIEGRKAPGV